ncbi:PASTA domain-containing protein [Halalkalirubrum salinum]|uniref:PASTA domain-containing protein n=1 Tax=Halalkalirubrum salinum TaxID=2563889 RepID=UPI0010FB71AF|nr:PASTA domain-containing protein [Halalkalirubrum salinum]
MASRDRSSGLKTAITAELPAINTDKLSRTEERELAGIVHTKERLETQFRDRIIELEAEHSELQYRATALERDRDRLRERLDQLQADRPAIDPDRVVSAFSERLTASEALSAQGYEITDYSVELKANLAYEDDEPRIRLPGPTEEFVAANLSTIRFGVEKRDSDDALMYQRIPDVQGRSIESATRLLTEAGFAVGDREVIVGEPAGRVVEQFPRPGDVAQPGTEIDLVVSEAAGSGEDSEASTTAEHTKSEDTSEEAEHTKRVDTNDEKGETIDRDRTDRPDRTSPTDERTQPTDERTQPTDERTQPTATTQPVSAITGIGPTYSDRLGSVGIETVSDIQRADIETIADVASVSKTRAERWRELATKLAEESK